MKLIFTLSFYLILLISYCQAPATIWQKLYGGTGFDGDKGNGGAFSIYQTADSGSIVVGETYSTDGYALDNHGDEDMLILKLNNQGNVVWHKCYGGTSEDYPSSVKQTYDGGYIIVGTTGSNNGNVSGNHGQEDVWVIKLNSHGNITWQKCFGGSKEETGNDIQQTADSGYIIAGYANSNDSDITGIQHGLGDYWIVKITKSGEIEWQKLFGGNSVDHPYSIEKTLDGGYVVAGDTNSNNGDVSGNHGGVADCWLIKLDSTGALEWQKCIGGSLRDQGKRVKQTADSGYVVVMLTKSDDGDVIGLHGREDYLLTKVDKNGNIVWSKCFGGAQDDLPNDLELSDDYFVITGISNSVDGDVTGNHGNFDYWTLKVDSLGKIIWETSLGDTGDEEAFSISYKSHDGYLIGGESNSKPGGDYDFLIVKLTDDNILPVKLISFTAQKQSNATLLQWQTANEVNNDYFSIERSADSKLFTSIGTKQATDNALRSNYSFVNNAPLNGLNYYRLKQVDKDGKFSYSNIVSVDFSSHVATFALYPNPASGTLNITLPSTNRTYDIVLYDATGKEVLREPLTVNITSKQINISRLPAGVYNVVLVQDGKQKTLKVVKK